MLTAHRFVFTRRLPEAAAGAIMLLASIARAQAGPPLNWHDLMSIGTPKPQAGLSWGMSEAQIRQRHPDIHQPLTDADCTFILNLKPDSGRGLSEYRLAYVAGDAHKCEVRWLARLNSLYGKPEWHEDMVRVDQDGSAFKISQFRWLTPTTCAYLTYNPAARSPADRLWASFGDKQTDACGYDDQAVITGTPVR